MLTLLHWFFLFFRFKATSFVALWLWHVKKQRMVNMNMNKTTFVFTYFYLSVKADFKEEEEHFVQLFVINNLGRRKIKRGKVFHFLRNKFSREQRMLVKKTNVFSV